MYVCVCVSYNNGEDAKQVPQRGCEPDKDVVLTLDFLQDDIDVNADLGEEPNPEEDFKDKPGVILAGQVAVNKQPSKC